MAEVNEHFRRLVEATPFRDWAIEQMRAGRLRSSREGNNVRLWTVDEKGKMHGLGGGPALVELSAQERRILAVEWRQHGLLHRTDGPALMRQSASGPESISEYRVRGALHRTDGPAVEAIARDGTILHGFYRDGVMHREDGPARLTLSRSGEPTAAHWIKDGRYAEDGQPNRLIWTEKGELHEVGYMRGHAEHGFFDRANGPAYVVAHPNGRTELGYLQQGPSYAWRTVELDGQGQVVRGGQQPGAREEASRALAEGRERARECATIVSLGQTATAQEVYVVRDRETGELVHNLTGGAVAVAGRNADEGDVARLVKKQNPTASLTIIAEHGREARVVADVVANEMGGRVIAPRAELMAPGERTFADLARRGGQAIVRAELAAQGISMRASQGRSLGLRV